MRATVKAFTLAVAFGSCMYVATADASGPEDSTTSELEEMRREMRALKAEMKTLREAVIDVAAYTQKSADILAGVLSGHPVARSELPSQAPGEAPAAPRVRARPPGLPVVRETKSEAAQTAVLKGKVHVPSGEPVAFVYVENVPGAPVQDKVTINQKDKQFVPSWAVVRSGTTIAFPNNDNIYHNVFSLSSGNTFDLGLYNSGAEAKTRTFRSAGAVDIYCNIHPNMAASVLVVPNQLFAKVKPDGSFEIKGVPQGQRKLVAWAPGSKMTSQWVELTDGSANIELTLQTKSRAHMNKQGRSYGSYE